LGAERSHGDLTIKGCANKSDIIPSVETLFRVIGEKFELKFNVDLLHRSPVNR
jgi:hypothetical protein